MLTKFERLLSKSLTTLEVMTYYLVVHTGPGLRCLGSPSFAACAALKKPQQRPTCCVIFLPITAVTMQFLHITGQKKLCTMTMFVCWLVGCLTSQQQASASQGRICSDNFTCCHTEIEVADQTFYLTQSQYTDTGPTSPRADPRTPGAWQGSQWSANFGVTGMTRPRKNPGASGIRTRDLPLSRRTPYH